MRIRMARGSLKWKEVSDKEELLDSAAYSKLCEEA